MSHTVHTEHNMLYNTKLCTINCPPKSTEVYTAMTLRLQGCGHKECGVTETTFQGLAQCSTAEGVNTVKY
jgi:hypothetical protein